MGESGRAGVLQKNQEAHGRDGNDSLGARQGKRGGEGEEEEGRRSREADVQATGDDFVMIGEI